MPHIALVTCHEMPNLYHGEKLLLEALDKQNIHYTPAIWNSPEISWESYDAIILRNTWDYHQQASAFLAWLDFLEAKQFSVFNPIPLLRWNMNKVYLQALSNCGIRILPTVFANNGSISLEKTLKEQALEEAIVKPLISASGHNTWKITPETASNYQQQFDFIQARFGAMIQPYAPQIGQVGELSFIFFDGKFSHSVLKTPAQGNLFVHEEHGGKNQAFEATAAMITQAQSALSALQELTGILPLYARVDGFMDGDSFVLMELECIEPELYTPYTEGAAERFAQAILAKLS